jgi:arylsulfatase A-like enzyme
MLRRVDFSQGWAVALLALPLMACGARTPPSSVILISIDTLRADHLGAYGYSRPTSPFFDELARDSALFERAFIQVPGTLPSHMSMLTGLYPAQHGVYPPDGVLSPDIPTLSEILQWEGYRTAGFTEGGYVAGSFGFDRGFDAFDDHVARTERDFEAILAKGVAFLDGLGGEEPFFLFLHTYAVHDPYQPPAEYRNLFWEGEPPATFAPTGPNLVAVNRGARTVTPEAVRYYEALYDAGIRYVDDQLRRFWDRLTDAGLTERTVLVITSDHGEEFLEHGSLVHEQAYVETTHVPLLVRAPGVPRGVVVGSLVESVDLAPSLLELVDLASEARQMAGRSWVRLLSTPDATFRDAAYSESVVHPVRALVHRDRETAELLHLLESRLPAEAEGQWIGRQVQFDTLAERIEVEAESYHVARSLSIESGEETARVVDLRPDEWTSFSIELPPGLKRLRLSVAACEVPFELGLGEDRRCLGFRLRGPDLVSWELYDLADDPAEQRDLAAERQDAVGRLSRRLGSLRWQPVAESMRQLLSTEDQEDLRALGYLQ